MTDKQKLELTLCGIIPYKAKWTDKRGTERQLKYNNLSFAYMPHLHSLDKLTIEHYSEILELDVEYLEDGKVFWQTFNPYGTVDHEYFLKIEENEDKEFVIIEYYSIDGKEQEPKILDYLKLEILKKLHVNIFNLPKEMYIEKSTIQTLKQN